MSIETLYADLSGNVYEVYTGEDEYDYNDYGKAFLKFPIEEALRGRTALSALLYMNCSVSQGSAQTVSAKSTTDTWDGTKTGAQMEALTLSTLSSQSVTGTGQFAFDVLGDVTKGVQQALTNEAADVSLVLTITPTHTPQTEVSFADSLLSLGDDLADKKAFTGINIENEPTLLIEFEDGGTFAMFAGRVE